MRGMTTLAAALLLGLSTAAAQDRSGDDAPARKPPARGGSWLTGWWPFGHKAEPKKTHAEPEKRPPSIVESARVVRIREEAALQRRQAVCLKLMEIGMRKNDPELQRQAEELDSFAWETYMMRISHLPSSGAVVSPDEGTLTRRLGPGASGPDAAALSNGGRGGQSGGSVAERRDR